MIGWVLLGVGAVATIIAAVLDAHGTVFAWTAAFGWATGLVLGALVLALLAPLAPIRWISGLLPAIRALAANAPLLVLLFVPVALGVPWLYGWAHPDALEPSVRQVVEARGAWQTPRFFLLRSGVYLGVWVAASRFATRSVVPRAGLTGPVIGLVAVAITWTLASFDWWMSLEAGWSSSVYGIYTFAGGFGAALAATVLLARVCEKRGDTPPVPPDVYHALGRLVFAFCCFWAYIFWAQFLVVWIGGLPGEARHLVVRLRSWVPSLVALLLGHFALPFALLLGRAPKRSPRFLSAVCVVVLVAHATDMAWLVLPAHWPVDPLLAPPEPVPLLLLVLVGPYLTVAGLLTIATRARLSPVSAAVFAPTLAYRSP